MTNQNLTRIVFSASTIGLAVLLTSGDDNRTIAPPGRKFPDAIAEAQTTHKVANARPEQEKSAHDRSKVFAPNESRLSSEALIDQPDSGAMNGFDFYKDPLGAMKPGTTFEENDQAAVTAKPKAIAPQGRWNARAYAGNGNLLRQEFVVATPALRGVVVA